MAPWVTVLPLAFFEKNNIKKNTKSAACISHWLTVLPLAFFEKKIKK